MNAAVNLGFTALLIYTMIWSLLIFMVLPFGVKPPANPEQGHVPSAPERPLLLRKVVITSVLSALLTALVLWLIHQGVMPMRDVVR